MKACLPNILYHSREEPLVQHRVEIHDIFDVLLVVALAASCVVEGTSAAAGAMIESAPSLVCYIVDRL